MEKLKKRLPAKERKKQILKSAVKVFARSNYYNTKMSDIAKEAGISEAMIYRHFSSKKEIFIVVLKHMSDRILTFWERELDPVKSPLEKLRSMLLGYYQRMIKHPNELKVQFLAISGIDDKDVLKRLRTDQQNYIKHFSDVIQEGISQREIRKDVDVNALAFAYNGSGIMMNMMRLLGFTRKFNEKTVVSLIDHFIESIKV
ncbi:MAG: TetR/AcrR family transcriptional regulator [Desulfobacteraceae bacterium]|uniref:TetR/AcrR family transcriptional regulator n=1 Tax=Candidatus Desulfacyla euxinica TaxID=2841693 RepID=A0A8J6T857_9DELT|nr:TetR/AcrR family transcriptional regulator [Candidatus Desulfacyla euxinica]MBL6978245.1 TetR/AcrR family transcriptional regulator [Desulfobacteraceae bacterium]MBL7216380.1 TetR/AcrR family transcriptional regulator [Desulfobacteraceae bacterium]